MEHTGLTSKEVLESRAKWGHNDLTPPKKVSLLKLFIEKFNDPIIRILMIAAVLSFAISFTHNDFTETLGIIIAIFLATGVGFWFEVDASRKFDLLNTIGDQTLVRVMRDGVVVEVSKSDIVKGDIVLLETGEEIPADGTLLESTALIVNESTLTGESSISKTTDQSQFKKDATYPSNVVLRGTTVLEGGGVMEVTKIGDQTEIGKVATASTEESGEKTPLTKQLDRLAKIIGVAGFALASLTFIALLFGDLFSEKTDYSFAQLWLLFSALISFLIMIARFWMPIVGDAHDLLYASKEPAKKRSAIFWVLVGMAFFVVSVGIGYLAFGIDPLNRLSWLSLDHIGNILNFFMIAVTMIVVAVPEGLPMSVTLSLALNMRRMLKSNNLVRKMHACETMGAINVICTDKTGTLTKNQMSVQERFFDNFDRDKNVIFEGIAANSTAHIDFSDKAALKSIGNPTESSLILWMYGEGVNYIDLREKAQHKERVPFSTLRKYMATS
ncbi:MAG: HAD-IC family P-type ATPase, partial [Rikenellaceae bacterium]